MSHRRKRHHEEVDGVLFQMVYTHNNRRSQGALDSVPDHHSPKERNLQLCQTYRTISLIIHPSKVMLRFLLNRLKPQAEEIIKEEQAGFRVCKTEQIFNFRIFCENYLQHQQSLYHVFFDLKKAFDRVRHAALWATMRLLTSMTT